MKRPAVMTAARWLIEAAGVGLVAVAASLWSLPAAVAIAGVYLILAANSGGEEQR